MAWTPLWSLTHQTTKYLPTAFLYFGSFSNKVSTTPACSNGLAAGNNLEEAILQGFMELVERDSVSIWWYNRLRRPAIDLHSFPNPYIHQLVEYYRSIGRELWALDVTHDMGIPTFAAISRDVKGPRDDLIFGFGAHFDPQIALLRALTETNQGVSAFLYMNGEIPEFNEEGTDWWSNATLENQQYMAPDPTIAPRRLQDFEPRWHNDIRDDVLLCVDIAAQNGLETLVIDQTQPDVGLSVAKVIVPGMRHFWRRLAPGRLYDVPVKMGWLEQPLTEEELNPYSVFI
ncbi:MAG: YcaO-like family protein [Anaerolineae bacterium]|nr:YcaO-like family protein [Anaerolineae bacterium]